MKSTITLKKNYEFKKLLSKGKWIKGRYVTIYFNFSDKLLEKNENEIGFVVSRKAGNSVFRNRTRRIIRQAYSDLEEHVNKGYKILIMWKKDIKGADVKSTEIKEDLEKAFTERGLM